MPYCGFHWASALFTTSSKTLSASTFTTLQIILISLKNEILQALKRLWIYFCISASSIEVWTIGQLHEPYIFSSVSPDLASNSPTVIIQGFLKSSSFLCSLKYSGFIQTPKSWPAFLPEYFSRRGINDLTVVLGGTVLLTTTIQ